MSVVVVAAAKAAWTLALSLGYLVVALADPDTATALVPLYVLGVVLPLALPWCVSALRREHHG